MADSVPNAPAGGGEPGGERERVPSAAEVATAERANRAVLLTLRTGVLVSGVLVAIGLALQVFSGRASDVAVRMADVLQPTQPGLRLVGVGLIVLAVTPLLRVIALIVLWARQRDHRFVGIAAFVLASVFLGIALGLVL